MVSKRSLIILLLTVFIIGWGFGYLSLPYLPYKHQYWLGAVSAIAAFMLFFVLKGGRINNKFGIVFLAVLMVGLSGGLYLFKSMLNEKNAANLRTEELMIESKRHDVEMRYAQESIYQKRLVDKFLQGIEVDSTEILSKFVDFSMSLELADKFFGDSLIKLSPGRGYLLFALIESELDNVDKKTILSKVDFSHAEVRTSDLTGLDLRNIKLRSALFYRSDLKKTDLSHAYLDEAIFFACKMDSTALDHASLENANLSWSSFNNSRLIALDALGADFSHSSMRNALIDSSRFKWANFQHAILVNSSIRYVDFLSAKLQNANLSFSDLKGSRLSRAILNNCDLSDTKLNAVSIYTNWFEKIEEYQVIGKDEITGNYEIEEAKSPMFSIETHALRVK